MMGAAQARWPSSDVAYDESIDASEYLTHSDESDTPSLSSSAGAPPSANVSTLLAVIEASHRKVMERLNQLEARVGPGPIPQAAVSPVPPLLVDVSPVPPVGSASVGPA